jgi:hypothetical protein
LQIAEIFGAPPGEGSAYVTGDREGQDDRSSLGVTTASDNSEALLAPFLISSSASPATVSPVTVIEVFNQLSFLHMLYFILWLLRMLLVTVVTDG